MGGIPILTPIADYFRSQIESLKDERVSTAQKAKIVVSNLAMVASAAVFIAGCILHSGDANAKLTGHEIMMFTGADMLVLSALCNKRFRDQAEVMRGVRKPVDVLFSSLICMGPGVQAPGGNQEPLIN